MFKKGINKNKIATTILAVILVVMAGLSLLPIKYSLSIEIANPSRNDVLQVFYDIGNGINEADSKLLTMPGVAINIQDPVTPLITVPLPAKKIKGIRIDPGTVPKAWYIKSIIMESKLAGFVLRSHTWLPEDIVRDFTPLHAIDAFYVRNKELFLNASGDDPFFGYKEDFRNVQMPLWEMARYFKVTIWVTTTVFGLFFLLLMKRTVLDIMIRFLRSTKYFLFSFSESQMLDGRRIQNNSTLYKSEHGGNQLLWLGVALLVLLKLLLLSGTAVPMTFSPHDDSLYLSRAFHLLMDGGLGPYDGRLLVKLPGISLWLAANRLLGIPYLLSINLLFAAAGIYFISALRRLNVNRPLLLLVFGLYLFNPVTISDQWFHIGRESLSIDLLVLMLASMLFALVHLQEKRLPIMHLIILAAVFSFAVMVREEDRLLYALLGMFVALVLWMFWPIFRRLSWTSRSGVLVLVFLPFLLALAVNFAMRSHVERHYGVPLLYDFGEGEFPRLIAAIRSVESLKDNRHVMVTQEALGKIRIAVPAFAPVIDRLPAPSQTSYSCKRFNVCDEWTNGWELFWIKDAAFASGLTPTLPASQAYFRRIRLEIERACQDGRLKCGDKGQGLFPPFESRWTRAFLLEMSGVLNMMTMPVIGVVGAPPPTYSVDVDLGRMYQFVTMTHHYDSHLQSNYDEGWKNQPKDLYLSLKYWLRYPDVAVNPDVGPKAGGEPFGAQIHYQRHGQHEGRVWQDIAGFADQGSGFVSPIESWKAHILELYKTLGWVLEILGALAFLLRLSLWRRAPLSPLMCVALMFTLFTGVRLLAMSYISVYMGGLDARLFFSTYVVVLLMAPLIMADLLALLVAHRGWPHPS
ncbi:MAG: hypothetical protein ACYDAA_07270 [Syntrophales bacterium]